MKKPPKTSQEKLAEARATLDDAQLRLLSLTSDQARRRPSTEEALAIRDAAQAVLDAGWIVKLGELTVKNEEDAATLAQIKSA